MDKAKKSQQGGARAGAGAPKKPRTMKKKQICLALPPWLVKQIDTLPRSRAVEIEQALCDKFGWEPPAGADQSPDKEKPEGPEN